MTVDGRENLFQYTHLNANGYLKKFRKALNLPNLSLSMLVALLKTYEKKYKENGFITTNKDGIKCLYNKEILNKILGMSNDGYFYLKPEQNHYLKRLHGIIDEWDRNEIEKGQKSQGIENIPPYENDEEDMQKMSDKLIHDDNYGEIAEGKKIGKRIHITESQFKNLKKCLAESYFIECNKVKIVKNFLDKTFIKGALPSIGEDGYGKAIPIVAMKIPFSDEPKNMTATQAFYLLQDKYNKIYSDPKQRDSFLKKVLINWYYDKITPEGMIIGINNY